MAHSSAWWSVHIVDYFPNKPARLEPAVLQSHHRSNWLTLVTHPTASPIADDGTNATPTLRLVFFAGAKKPRAFSRKSVVRRHQASR